MLDSAAVARPDLVTGPVFKFTLQATKDEEPEFLRAYGVRTILRHHHGTNSFEHK